MSVFDVFLAVRIQNSRTNRRMCTVTLLCTSFVRLCKWPCGAINVCIATSVSPHIPVIHLIDMRSLV